MESSTITGIEVTMPSAPLGAVTRLTRFRLRANMLDPD